MTSDLFSLDGRVALVTGSVQGLGKAVAIGLARHGAHVILNGRSEQRLAKVESELQAADLAVSTAAFDVADYTAAQGAIENIEKTHGHLDILVNNVGYRDRRSIDAFDQGAMGKMLDINLVAPFELSRMAAKGMTGRRWGRIINVTSVVAQIAGAGDATYIAAKGGLESLTRALAAEYGPFGVTVNGISPGFFMTEPNRHLVKDEKLLTWLKGRTALGRWAEPDELSGAAVFLASEAGSYVTGQVLGIDGGMLGHL